MAADAKDEFSDAKFQRFATSVERALKSFEVTKEWHDLISAMARLNKVLLAYTHIHSLPHKHLVAKRLAQCLHPSLPGGVHLKSLDVYKAIFSRIGPDGLAADLFLYCSGLFPLFDYASMQVRPAVLDIYEQYLLPLGPRLIPSLQGLVLSLLPGLEDESEHTERVGLMLDAICRECQDTQAFCAVVWNILFCSPSARPSAASYILLHVTKSTSMAKVFQTKDESTVSLMVSALCSTVLDPNILVERSALDIISLVFPLHQPHVTTPQLVQLLTASLLCLLKRDISLSRRFFSWVLGSGVAAPDPSPSDVFDALSSAYFNTHSRSHLVLALKGIFRQGLVAVGSEDKVACLLPYRLVRAMLDKPEVAVVVSDFLDDIVSCFVGQLQQLGGSADGDGGDPASAPPASSDHKASGCKVSLRSEIVHTGTQMLTAIDTTVLWGWIEAFLVNEISSCDSMQAKHPTDSPASGAKDLKSRLELVQFLLTVLPLGSMESAISFHLPLLLVHLLTAINYSLSSTSFSLFMPTLQSACDFCLQFLSTIHHSPVSSSSSLVSSPSMGPNQSFAGAGLLSRGAFSLGSTMVAEPGGLRTELLHQCQHLVQLITEVHVAGTDTKLNGGQLGLHLAKQIQFVTEAVGRSQKSGVNEVAVKVLDPSVLKCFHSACTCLLTAARMSLDLPSMTSSMADESGGWVDALMFGCLCVRSSHLAVISLDTLLSLRRMYPETRPSVGLSEMPSIAVIATLLPKRRDFIKAASTFAWALLSPPSLFHEQAAGLLMQLYALSQCTGTIEGVLLESFTAMTVVPFERYTVLWQYALVQQVQQGALSMKRVTLRFLEGLQSQNPHIRQIVKSWLKFVCQKKQLHLALLPVYNLIMEACPAKQDAQLPPPSGSSEEDPPHLRYWKKKDADDPQPEKKPKLLYPSYYFSQPVDSPRLQYALSLLQSVIDFDGSCVCMALISPATNPHLPSAEGASDFLESAASLEIVSPRPSIAVASAGQHSLLELVLAESVAILLSEYAEQVSLSEVDSVNLLEVKTRATVLACSVLTAFVQLLSSHQPPRVEEDEYPRKLENPCFVFSLLTLCEVQKGCLFTLYHHLQMLLGKGAGALSDKKDGAVSSSFPDMDGSFMMQRVEPLLVQLLRMAFVLIVLDPLCATNVSTNHVLSVEKSKCDTELNLLPGYGLTSQPLFLHIVSQILSSKVFSPVHSALLYLFRASLPYLQVHLETMASKVVKQICKNSSKLLNELPAAGRKEHQRNPSFTSHMDSEGLVSHMEALVAIVNFCLFGMDVFRDDTLPVPYYRGINFMYDIPTPAVPNRNAGQETPVPADKSASGALSWLFGTMFGSGAEETHVQDHLEVVYTGLGSPAGKKILWMLPMVYRTITRLWKQCCSSGSKFSHSCLESHIAEDMKYLITRMLQPLLTQHHILFYSSISQVWMQWNAAGKDKKLLRESFLEMFHLLKLQPLKEMLASIKQTVVNLAGDGDPELALERQKHLLHFLYRFIYSSLQSSEELTNCLMELISLLKDCYQLFVVGMESSSGNISVICMLTSILHVLVCRVSLPDPRSQKKERRSLQDLIHRLCECLAQAVGSGLGRIHTSATPTKETTPVELHRPSSTTSSSVASPSSAPAQEGEQVAATGNTTSKPAKEKFTTTYVAGSHDQPSTRSKNDVASLAKGVKDEVALQDAHVHGAGQMPQVDALAVLSHVLCHFIDYAYSTAEKDRIHSLLKAVFKAVWPILREYNVLMPECHHHGVRLLASLSSFQVTRRSWKDEVMDIFLGPAFFMTDESSLLEWKTVVDNLVSQDKFVFSSLLSRLPASSYPAAGVVNIFSSQEQERLQRSRLLKRIAFVILAGEKEQYAAYQPQINEKLVDALRCYSGPVVSAEVFLTFRVLLLQLSRNHLVSLWPALLSELMSTLSDLEADLVLELTGKVSDWPKERLHCYLSACKLLDMALALPSGLLPHLQLVCWEFNGSHGAGIVGKLLKAFSLLFSDDEEGDVTAPAQPLPLSLQLAAHPPFLGVSSLSSLSSLYPFFSKISLYHRAVSSVPTSATLDSEAEQALRRIQQQLLCDFLES